MYIPLEAVVALIWIRVPPSEPNVTSAVATPEVSASLETVAGPAMTVQVTAVIVPFASCHGVKSKLYLVAPSFIPTSRIICGLPLAVMTKLVAIVKRHEREISPVCEF